MLTIKCESDKGGCVEFGPNVTASYAVASVGDLPTPEILYVWVTMPDGHQVQLFVNRESGLVVVDYCHKNGKGGNELFRCKVNAKAMLSHAK